MARDFATSDFSLTLVLQIKTSNIINDVAKVRIKSEKITPFGGIFHVKEHFGVHFTNKGCPSNWTPCLLASLKYCFEAFVGGTGIAVDIIACSLACLGKSFWG